MDYDTLHKMEILHIFQVTGTIEMSPKIMIGLQLRGLTREKRMDSTLTSNLIIVIIVSAVLYGLIPDKDTTPAQAVEKNELNTLITQKIFRECGNSADSNSTCVKLVDDLVQGLITKEEFLNYIKHSGIDKGMAEDSQSNSL